MRRNKLISRSASRQLALEQRLLFDGAAMVAAQDVQEVREASRESKSPANQHAGDDTARQWGAWDEQALAAHDLASSGHTLALVDARLPQHDSLVSGLRAQGAQVYIVNAQESGLQAIERSLSSSVNVQNLSIYSVQDADGQVLGSDQLSAQAMQAAATAPQHGWHYYLTENASIDVFGSDALANTSRSAHASD